MIRANRKRVGMSQSQLAEALGLTFQQVQKYERGSNRVSASKLFEIAQTLDLTISTFFEGLDRSSSDGESISADLIQFANLRGADTLIHAYRRLTPNVRRALANLAGAMSGQADEVDDGKREIEVAGS
ncbi:MAG: helix-turn-helix transcriptional regulator [Caulobacter sp.]|nr:helix-turn-helix transcriptional regulator [Caulobacter sp.]